jgi:hypothetical protein
MDVSTHHSTTLTVGFSAIVSGLFGAVSKLSRALSVVVAAAPKHRLPATATTTTAAIHIPETAAAVAATTILFTAIQSTL